jgi:hypothetical protein
LQTATGGDTGAFLCLAAMALVAAGICVGMRGSLRVVANLRPIIGVVGEETISSLPMP